MAVAYAEHAVGARQVGLDRLDAEEQLGGDRAVALAGGGQLADLALARGERGGALERRAPWPQSGGDELAPGALRQERGTGAIGVGQRGAQRLTGFDATPDPGQRASQLEPQANRLERRRVDRRARRAPARSSATRVPIVRLGHGAGVPGAGDRRPVRRTPSPARARSSAERDRLVAAAEMGERQRGGRAPAAPGGIGPALPREPGADLAGVGVGLFESPLGEQQPGSGVQQLCARRRRRGQQFVGRLECPTFGQGADEHASGPGGELVRLVTGKLERPGRESLGIGELARAQCQLRLVPGRHRAHRL